MNRTAICVKTLIFSVLMFTGHLVLAQQEYRYTQPTSRDDGWKTASMISEGMNTALIDQLFDQLGPAKHKIHSVLLVKDDQLILEEYFGSQTIETRHDLRSVTKSLRSILTGIAIDRGFIDSIDDPISNYLGDLQPKKNLDPRKAEITIRHLLTMSTGLECNDWDPRSAGQEDRVYKKKDWLQYTLDLPMVYDPGTESRYCSMGVVLLVELISRASGMSIDVFARKYLFDAMNISNYSWRHTSRKEVISSGKRLSMTARDMAKIGQLILNKGKWKEQQLVSKEWITLSTQTHTDIDGMSYGFLWWKIPLKLEDRQTMSTTATGNGGQYIVVLPEMNSIAVFTGGAYNSAEDKLPFAIVRDILIPTLNPKN